MKCVNCKEKIDSEKGKMQIEEYDSETKKTKIHNFCSDDCMKDFAKKKHGYKIHNFVKKELKEKR